MAGSALIDAHDLRRDYKVQKNALRGGRFGLGFMRREMDIVKAIDGVDFAIQPATSVGLIGLNGAGKSTLLKLITGILVPTSGELLVGGIRPHERRKDVARQVGVVFGHRTQLWFDVPVIDSLKVLRRVYSVSQVEFDARLEQLTNLLEMGDLLSRSTRQLSLGQRVRAEIMASLLHGPRLLILDEPTVGLDIIAKANIRRLIRSLVSEQGVTVILASHEVADIEEICDRAILIHRGKLLYDGTLEELKARAQVERSLVVEVVRDGSAAEPGSQLDIEHVTVPLGTGEPSKALAELAATRQIVGASVTGGSLETILARMFGEVTGSET